MQVGTMTAPAVAVAALLTAAPATGAGFLDSENMAASAATVQEPIRVETYDDLLVRVEEKAPGFGGMFIDSAGKLVVYLLDTSQLSAARSAIEAVFGPGRIPAAGVRALRGQYVVSQLQGWARRARVLFELNGVTLVDLDEAKNRVMVGVESESRTRAVEQALSSLGVPRGAVVIRVTGQIRPVDSR